RGVSDRTHAAGTGRSTRVLGGTGRPRRGAGLVGGASFVAGRARRAATGAMAGAPRRASSRHVAARARASVESDGGRRVREDLPAPASARGGSPVMTTATQF